MLMLEIFFKVVFLKTHEGFLKNSYFIETPPAAASWVKSFANKFLNTKNAVFAFWKQKSTLFVNSVFYFFGRRPHFVSKIGKRLSKLTCSTPFLCFW